MARLGYILATFAGLALIVVVLRDAFETMILPRRLSSRFRFTRLYFRTCWPIWAGLAGRFRNRRRRESALSLFGPLSMLLLFLLWAVALMLGFALIYWGSGAHRFGDDLYFSGLTLLTLGLTGGPVIPLYRLLTVAEGGLGLGFVAIVISYLPVLYTGFSAREANIAMLDARAGSPPSASELLRRHADGLDRLERYLAEWERWSAQLLESHISYPVLGYFRSQHVNQSWLSALTTLLDACALLLTGADAKTDAGCVRQAQLTFAIARHAVVDLAQIFIQKLPRHIPDRLPESDFIALRDLLHRAGAPLHWDAERIQQLAKLRHLYEPHVWAIAAHLRLDPPHWLGDAHAPDNWQRSPWDRAPSSALGRPGERHF